MWIAPERRRAHRWVAPGVAVAAGVAVGATIAIRGQLETGLVTLGVLLGYGVLLAYRRGETALTVHEAFSGRRSGVHMRAAAMTGDIVVGVIVSALIIQALRGEQIWILAGLAGIAGLSYLVSIIVYSNTY
jgi:hypothetical protein